MNRRQRDELNAHHREILELNNRVHRLEDRWSLPRISLPPLRVVVLIAAISGLVHFAIRAVFP